MKGAGMGEGGDRTGRMIIKLVGCERATRNETLANLLIEFGRG